VGFDRKCLCLAAGANRGAKTVLPTMATIKTFLQPIKEPQQQDQDLERQLILPRPVGMMNFRLLRRLRS